MNKIPCDTYIDVIQNEDPCGGERKSTDCVIYENAIIYLGLPANSTMTSVLQAVLASLIDARNRIAVLEQTLGI